MKSAENKVLNKIVGQLEHLNKRLDKHDEQFGQINTRLDKHDGHFAQINTRLDKQGTRLEQQGSLLAQLFNKVASIEDQMVTRTEFQEFRSTIYSHIDGFVKLHEKLDVEVVALTSAYGRLDERITKLEPAG